jgi:hypothetical protein
MKEILLRGACSGGWRQKGKVSSAHSGCYGSRRTDGATRETTSAVLFSENCILKAWQQVGWLTVVFIKPER